MAFRWLMQDHSADQTEARRGAMAGVMDAAAPQADRIAAMDLRVQAKRAEARFGFYRVKADWPQGRPR